MKSTRKRAAVQKKKAPKKSPKKAAKKSKPARPERARSPGGDDRGARAEVARLMADLERLSAELDRERQRASASGEGELRVELDAARAELRTTLESLERARFAHEREAGEVRAQREEMERLRTEALRAAVDASASGQKLIELEMALASARRDIEAARRDAETVRKDLVDARRDAAENRRALDAAKTELGSYKLRCPKCGKNFVEEQYEGITIDSCTGCDAVYFDAGEVDQLLAKWREKLARGGDNDEKSGWWAGLFRRKPKAGEPGSG